MKWMLLPTLLVGLVVGGSVEAVPSSTLSQATTQPESQNKSKKIYLGSQYGFRFVYPANYSLDSATAYRASDDPNLVQSIEIWKASEYSPLLYQSEPTGAEWPAHISIEVYANPDKKPLENWVSELKAGEVQVKTVAEQGALAFASTGLYEYDNVILPIADGRYVLKLQVGHLDATDPMRQDFQALVNSLVLDDINPEGGLEHINYNRLRSLLNDQNWEAADIETRMIMQLAMGSDYTYPHLSSQPNSLNQVPCSQLQVLDALWTEASNGRFGFSAQKRIWDAIKADTVQSRVEQFGNQVGWQQSPPANEGPLGGPWRADVGLNYSLSAPVGHLPWVGTSSAQLQDFLMQSGAGCGSCTIDAIYISTDRFKDYLEDQFARLDQCPCTEPE
ncbi:MAG TPA: GUN4 domain-containing protein [Leptolyngbyaceae cyanobacterium]